MKTTNELLGGDAVPAVGAVPAAPALPVVHSAAPPWPGLLFADESDPTSVVRVGIRPRGPVKQLTDAQSANALLSERVPLIMRTILNALWPGDVQLQTRPTRGFLIECGISSENMM